MATILISHSSHVYSQLSEPIHKPKLKSKKELFYEKLPRQFNRQKYVEIAQSLTINDKTAQGYIRNFKDNAVISSVGHDQYFNPNAIGE